MNATVANAVPNPIIERLEDQIRWYGVRSRSNMNWIRYHSAGARSSKYDLTNFLRQKNYQCS
jgi:hypothetical protein